MVFLKALDDVSAEERGTLALQCEVSDPHARVVWRKDGVELGPSDKYDLLHTAGTRGLVVHDLSRDDAGLYTCHLDNEETRARVSVHGAWGRGRSAGAGPPPLGSAPSEAWAALLNPERSGKLGGAGLTWYLRGPGAGRWTGTVGNQGRRGDWTGPCLMESHGARFRQGSETFTVHQGMCVGRCEACQWSLLEIVEEAELSGGGCPGRAPRPGAQPGPGSPTTWSPDLLCAPLS